MKYKDSYIACLAACSVELRWAGLLFEQTSPGERKGHKHGGKHLVGCDPSVFGRVGSRHYKLQSNAMYYCGATADMHTPAGQSLLQLRMNENCKARHFAHRLS